MTPVEELKPCPYHLAAWRYRIAAWKWRPGIGLGPCLCPDHEGGLVKGEHVFDKDGFCAICGNTRSRRHD